MVHLILVISTLRPCRENYRVSASVFVSIINYTRFFPNFYSLQRYFKCLISDRKNRIKYNSIVLIVQVTFFVLGSSHNLLYSIKSIMFNQCFNGVTRMAQIFGYSRLFQIVVSFRFSPTKYLEILFGTLIHVTTPHYNDLSNIQHQTSIFWWPNTAIYVTLPH